MSDVAIALYLARRAQVTIVTTLQHLNLNLNFLENRIGYQSEITICVFKF